MRKGKIVTRSLPDTGTKLVGTQVIVGRRVGIVKTYSQIKGYTVFFNDGNMPHNKTYEAKKLFRLVVMSEGEKIPVRWSQWQAAIQNKLVDNFIEIEFEEKLIDTISGPKQTASIIKLKELQPNIKIIEETLELCSLFGFERNLPEAIIEINKLKKKYEK